MLCRLFSGYILTVTCKIDFSVDVIADFHRMGSCGSWVGCYGDDVNRLVEGCDTFVDDEEQFSC